MKSKNAAPFGVNTVRFASIGFHPGLDAAGAICRKSYNLGPGQYRPKSHECSYKKTNTSPWTRKLQMEDFSTNLGYKNHAILNETKYYRAGRGPGTYDFTDEGYVKTVTFGNVRRFREFDERIPPPGIYQKDILATSSIIKKQMTNVPPMEWDGFRDRFTRPNMPWKLPSNLYDPIDHNTMEAVAAKIVSKRGPYDCFTGPRDETTIKNYFSSPMKCTPDKFYTYPSEMDHLLHDKNKRRIGEFLKDGRFAEKPTVRMMLNDLSTCYKDPNHPSPASYDHDGHCIKAKKASLYPFNDSKLVVRQFVHWKIQPGTGRYHIKYNKCKVGGKKKSWVFKSKTGRTEYKAITYGHFD